MNLHLYENDKKTRVPSEILGTAGGPNSGKTKDLDTHEHAIPADEDNARYFDDVMTALTGERVKETVRPAPKTQQIPSELFSHSYAIFISSEDAPIYQNHINKENLQEKGIGIITRCKNPSTSAIVIPNHLNFKKIEREFWDLRLEVKNKNEFWGQYGLGYKGESWMAYDKIADSISGKQEELEDLEGPEDPAIATRSP